MFLLLDSFANVVKLKHNNLIFAYLVAESVPVMKVFFTAFTIILFLSLTNPVSFNVLPLDWDYYSQCDHTIKIFCASGLYSQQLTVSFRTIVPSRMFLIDLSSFNLCPLLSTAAFGCKTSWKSLCA